MAIIVSGLEPSTTYQICPEVSADGRTWSTGAGTTVTTQPLPSPHPQPPYPPTAFDTNYPDTAGYATETIASDCHNFADLMNAAFDRQAHQGTVINIPPGTHCGPYRATNGPAKDAVFYPATAVDLASSTIRLHNHGLAEGQGIVFGSNYTGTFPASTGCAGGIQSGQVYFAHVLDPNSFQVYCDAPASRNGTQVKFLNPGSGNEFFAPWPRKLKWIVIRTATPDAQFAPAHTRVTPAWAPKMASFVEPVSAIGDTPGQSYLFSFDDTDGNIQNLHSNIRITGIEFTTEDYPAAHTTADPRFWSHLLNVMPWNSNIVLDRIYVHLPGTPNRVTRGFFWDGLNVALVDSYLDNLTYWHPTYSGLAVAQSGAHAFTIAPGTHRMGVDSNGKQIVHRIEHAVTAPFSGSGSGRALVYFDFAHNGALTVSYPPGITGADCRGESCTVAANPGKPWDNSSCTAHENFPKTAAGEVTAGIIGCVDIRDGAVAAIHQGDATSSLWNTEGTNFMIGGQGPGPYIVENTYIEGAGLLWHHDDCQGNNHGCSFLRTRGDYTYIRNTFYQPRTLMFTGAESDGFRYYLRQPLEWKGGNRILLKGNIFDGEWMEDTPASVFIAFTSIDGQNISDVNLEDNTFRHGPGVVNLLNSTESSSFQTRPPIRQRFVNNLAWDIDGFKYNAWGGPNAGLNAGRGWLFQGPQASEDITVEHNTVIGNRGMNPAIMWLFDGPTEGIVVRNNFLSVDGDTEGMAQDGSVSEFGDTCRGLKAKELAACMLPRFTFDHNVLVGNGIGPGEIRSFWPGSTNYFARDSDLARIGLHPTSESAPASDFRVKALYCAHCPDHASDGKDIGVDIDQLEAAQGKVTLGTVAPDTTTATISFTAPDAQGCPVDISNTDPHVIAHLTRTPDPGGPRERKITLTGLAPHTTYHFRLDCAVEQPTGEFTTK